MAGAALNQSMGPGRATVIGQGGVKDSGQRGRVGAVTGGRDIAAAGSETAECLGAGPAAVTEKVGAVRSDGAGIIDLIPPALSAVLPLTRELRRVRLPVLAMPPPLSAAVLPPAIQSLNFSQYENSAMKNFGRNYPASSI